MKAQTGRTRHNSTLSVSSTLHGGGWSTPRPGRFTPGKETRYPLYRRLGGPKSRTGQVQKISPPTGIRLPDRPARSESPYRLSYPGPYIYLIFISILHSLSRQDLQTLYLTFTLSYQNSAYFLFTSRTVPTVFYWIDTLVKGESRDIQDSVHAEQCV